VFTMAGKIEEYRARRATELLRHMLQIDPTLGDLVSLQMLKSHEASFLAPNLLSALWRAGRYCRPVRGVDQSEWSPS
jgi:hypothetical protein